MIRQLFFLALFLMAPVTSAWANNSDPPDPAVLHANVIRTGEIAYKEGYFGTGENRLHYVEAGEGRLIVLYHGFPSFWFSWFDQMEMLKHNYRVVAVDALGAGRSAKPKNVEAYRIERLARQVDGLARHLQGSKRFTLIGHDWGAALAFAYAQAFPKRLDAVVGMSAPPYNLFLELVRSNTDQQRRSTYMQSFRAVSLDDIIQRDLGEQIWQQSYGALIRRADITHEEGELFRKALADPLAIHGGMNWYRANMPPVNQIDKHSFWPKDNAPIKVPTLLVWGEADGTFVPQFVEQMSGYALKLSVIRLPNINHWTTMEQSTAANHAIAAFLKTNARAALPARRQRLKPAI